MLDKLVDSIHKEYQTIQEAQINTLAKKEQQDRRIGLAPRNRILIFEAPWLTQISPSGSTWQSPARVNVKLELLLTACRRRILTPAQFKMPGRRGSWLKVGGFSRLMRAGRDCEAALEHGTWWWSHVSILIYKFICAARAVRHYKRNGSNPERSGIIQWSFWCPKRLNFSTFDFRNICHLILSCQKKFMQETKGDKTNWL